MKFKAIFDRNRFKNKEEEAPERLTSEEELELEGKLPGVCEKGVLRTTGAAYLCKPDSGDSEGIYTAG